VRKIVIASKPIIKCKQVKPWDVHPDDLKELLESLVHDGYSWAANPDEYNVYKVSCEGSDCIGVSAAEGELVCTDEEVCGTDGFWLDDKNVQFKTLTNTDMRLMAARKAKQLGIKLPKKKGVR
jgi:hypothetical protein